MIELNDLISRLDGETEIAVSDGENCVRGCVDDVADEVFRKFANTIVDRISIDDRESAYDACLNIVVKPIERRKR